MKDDTIKICNNEVIPSFPNGFTCWYESFYHFTIDVNHAINNKVDWAVELHANGGHAHVIEHVKEMTDKFEEKFKCEQWEELDWYDELNKFFEEYNGSTKENVMGSFDEKGDINF